MKKKKINNIIALLGALIVLLLIFAGVQKWKDAKKEAEKAEEEAAKIYAFEAGEVEKISYSDGETNWSFEKADGAWIYADDPEITLVQDTMTGMEEAFSKIEAVKVIENPDSLGDYGFEDPLYRLVVTEDGTDHTLLIGDSTGDNYYFMEEGTEKVYTISSDITSEMIWKLSSLAEKDTFPYVAQDDFVKMVVTLPNGTEHVYDSSDETQEETVADIANSFATTYFTDCADYHVTEETLVNYGLDEATRTKVTVTHHSDNGEQEEVIYIGSLDENGEYYYVQLEGSQRVNRVLKASVDAMLSLN